MTRRPDPHRSLISALEYRYGALDNLTSTSRSWASATFTGTRHELAFDLSLEAASDLIDSVAEADLPMTSHFVADIAVMASVVAANRNHLVVDALTIES